MNKTKLLLSILTLSFVGLTNAFAEQDAVPTTLPVPGDWNLVFSEDFNGDRLDPDKWRVGGRNLAFVGNSAIDTNNIKLNGGVLEITAEKRDMFYAGDTHEYVSGEISTYQNFRQKYGYFETRIKYDAVKGMWPSFWTMPDWGDYGAGWKTHESYLKFSVSDIPKTIGSATLKLKVVSADNDSGSPALAISNLAVYKLLSNSWDESTITFNNKPQFDPLWLRQFSGTRDDSTEIIPGQYLEVDVTDYINEKLNAGEDIGFALADIYMKSTEIVLGSKESKAESDRPRLLIDGQTIYPSDDAYVRSGQYADTNYQDDARLVVRDHWARSRVTYDGGMEIDIMESLGIWGDNKTQNALHWDGYGADHQQTDSGTLSISPTPDGYHVYAVDWRPGKMDFYIDNNLVWTYENPRVKSVAAYLILSLQVGGWAGNSDITDINGKLYVDYVRIYEEGLTNALDTTAPVITLTGEPSIEVIQNTPYIDEGITATDNKDDNDKIILKVTVDSNVNTAIPGSYTVKYNVSDLAGNAAIEVNRTVNVVAEIPPADTEAPIITLSGKSAEEVIKGSIYTDPGAMATDNIDKAVRISSIGEANTAVIGTYVITYSATDSAGNTSTKTRTVKVIEETPPPVTPDTTKPVITLSGEAVISLSVGETFIDPGYAAVDDRDGNIKATANGTIDTSKAGTYTLTYSATDVAGNTAVATRMVTVAAANSAPLSFTYTGFMTSENKITTEADVGEHSVTVSDGRLSDSQTITVTILTHDVSSDGGGVLGGLLL